MSRSLLRADEQYSGLKIEYMLPEVNTIMTSNTNISSDQSKILEELLYELLLYKKKDIIAIQEKLSINSNTNQTALNQSKKGKTLED